MYVTGAKAIGCWFVCGVPIAVGFLIPVGVLLGFIFKGYSISFNPDLGAAAINSLIIGVSVAFIIVTLSSFLIFIAKYKGGKVMQRLVGLASIGYAFPGTILAIGVVSIFDLNYRGWFGSGIGLIIVASVVRFQAVGYGAVSKGLGQIPVNIVEAGQLLGANFIERSVKIIFPMIRLSILAGGLLVFVDVMKELPMALLLRPFNFETLSTYLYQFAKDELLEEAALPALMIVITGIIPVIFLNYTINKLTRV
jgi:iron(III) transport system permease protein